MTNDQLFIALIHKLADYEEAMVLQLLLAWDADRKPLRSGKRKLQQALGASISEPSVQRAVGRLVDQGLIATKVYPNTYIRRCFNETARFERWLLRQEVRELSRGDFIEGASEEGAKRVTFLTEVLGPVPADIFSGKLAPRHSRRRTELTEQDKALLKQVSQQLAEAEAQVESTDAESEAAETVHLV